MMGVELRALRLEHACEKHVSALGGGGPAYPDACIGLDTWAPNLNLNRDPRWGRNWEVASEDPYLTGRVGEAYAQGFQQGPRRGAFNFTPMGVNSISSGSPHVRPMGCTCGEPDEIKKKYPPEMCYRSFSCCRCRGPGAAARYLDYQALGRVRRRGRPHGLQRRGHGLRPRRQLPPRLPHGERRRHRHAPVPYPHRDHPCQACHATRGTRPNLVEFKR